MSDLATCSYGEFKPEMGIPVRASLGLPRYVLPYTLDPRAKVWEITPRNTYLKASDEVYERSYLEQLEGYGVETIDRRFVQIASVMGGERLVVMCFERLGAKTHSGIRAGLSDPAAGEALICHRRLFASWWEQQTGRVVPELGSRLGAGTQSPDTPVDPPLLALF